MDVRDLKFKSNTFDVIIDKSTLDTIFCYDKCELSLFLMLKEAQRVLKTGGLYIIISHSAPENRLNYFVIIIDYIKNQPFLGFEINYCILNKEFEMNPNTTKVTIY